MRFSIAARLSLFLAAALLASPVSAEPAGQCSTEPDVKTALGWWPPQQNVWTPIGWKDHLFRFQVVYNGHLLCTPAGRLDKPHILKYKGKDFQFSAYPSPDGALPPMPRQDTKLRTLDGGIGLQGWREDHAAPVLWTDFPRQEGVVLRQEVFAHMKGGKPVERGDEPLYAWVRLSVKHVDPVRAPQKFYFAARLSRDYYDESGDREDSLFLIARPKVAKLAEALTSKPLPTEGGSGVAGLDVGQANAVRLRVLPGAAGPVTLAPTAPDSGVYNLKVELPMKEGAHTDFLIPMLVSSPDDIAAVA
jgi:hypothetical protein